MGEQIAKRTIDKFLMDLRITTNPHLQPQEAEKFLQELLDKRRQIWGPTEYSEKLDVEAFEALKSQLKNTSQAIKVK